MVSGEGVLSSFGGFYAAVEELSRGRIRKIEAPILDSHTTMVYIYV